MVKEYLSGIDSSVLGVTGGLILDSFFLLGSCYDSGGHIFGPWNWEHLLHTNRIMYSQYGIFYEPVRQPEPAQVLV